MQDILLATMAAVGWGLGYFVLSFCPNVNYFTVQILQSFVLALASMLAVVIQFYAFRNTITNNNQNNTAGWTVVDVLYDQLDSTKVGLLMIYSFLMFVSGTCFMIGYSMTIRPSLITILSSLYVLVTVLLLIIFKQELSQYNISYFLPGLVCCLLGNVLITLAKR